MSETLKSPYDPYITIKNTDKILGLENIPKQDN